MTSTDTAPKQVRHDPTGDPDYLTNYYNTFSSEKEKAVLQVPLRMVRAWSFNDGKAISEVFTEDGIMILPGDVFKQGREEIRNFMSAAYAGPFQGTGVTGTPVDLRFASDDVAIIQTHGGILAPGQEEIPPELAVRSTWVVVNDGERWNLAGYQNSPRGAGATLRW